MSIESLRRRVSEAETELEEAEEEESSFEKAAADALKKADNAELFDCINRAVRLGLVSPGVISANGTVDDRVVLTALTACLDKLEEEK